MPSSNDGFVPDTKRLKVTERLSQLGRDLKAIQTGAIQPDVVEYRREGHRFTVLIRPRGTDVSGL